MLRKMLVCTLVCTLMVMFFITIATPTKVFAAESSGTIVEYTVKRTNSCKRERKALMGVMGDEATNSCVVGLINNGGDEVGPDNKRSTKK